MCIDTDSGLVSDNDGDPFFDEQGEATDKVKRILDFLLQVHKNRQLTAQICTTLQQLDLIEPWPIILKGPEGEHPVQGLHRINEKHLNSLDDAAFAELRTVGALPLIYCQLLSMQHMDKLKHLVATYGGHNQQALVPDIEQIFGEKDADMFKFQQPQWPAYQADKPSTLTLTRNQP